MNISQHTIAVITSTIGRPELERAIVSVQEQEYPCRHYVFVDGKQYWDKIKPLKAKYPEVIFTYLPMNTGADGWTNSHINAIAPFLVKEDIICYLDDDNWYQPNHTQAVAEAFTYHENIEVAYTLRRLMTEQGDYLCDDDWESLGFWYFNAVNYSIDFNGLQDSMRIVFHRGCLVDTNCLAMNIKTARELAHHWTLSKQNDAHVWKQCLAQNKNIMATAKRTVNYVLNLKGVDFGSAMKHFNVKPEQVDDFSYHVIKGINQSILDAASPRDWHIPCICINGEITVAT